MMTHSLQTRKQEIQTKLTQLRDKMVGWGVDALILRQTPNVAWVTAGAATYINQAADTGPISILVTLDGAYVLTDTVEAPRAQQELTLNELGFEMVIEPWYDRGAKQSALLAGKKLASDASDGKNVAAEVQAMRYVLSPWEIERLHEGGARAARAMDNAIRAVRPGETEMQIAGRLAHAAFDQGGLPIVNLIATDDRIFRFRHPLPTDKKLEKYAMLVLCMRYQGLVLSVTRLVHFGPLPDEIQRKMVACARVDANMILGTKAGKSLGEMFELAKATYRAEGFPEAIEEHHQGGSGGYAPREVIAKQGDPTLVQMNQVFAWNPSIRGVKSEDTILLSAGGTEVVTTVANWPTMRVETPFGAIERPTILVVS